MAAARGAAQLGRAAAVDRDLIKLSCSCPDWASMCKHVAAVLYGIGARLDAQPALVFKLRAVDEGAMIARAAKGRLLGTTAPVPTKVLDGDDLSALFGLELESAAKPAPETGASAKNPGSAPAAKRLADEPPAPKRTPAKKSRTKPLTSN